MAPDASFARFDRLDSLLKGVSRSFYLSLRVLPASLRPQLSIAYLLARASDTVADTKVLPREKRLELLRGMREGRIEPVRGLAGDQGLESERELLRRLNEPLALKDSFSPADRRLIEGVLDTILQGQIFDLENFPGEDQGALRALSSDEDLDHYTYLVAGCVGEFWTRMCAAHLTGFEGKSLEVLCRLGVRFGKGLQLVNVLRDIPRDLRIGRCYLPVKDPRALLDPAAFESLRPVYERWLDAAEGHLDAAWEYVLCLPRSQGRLRLACIWPVWIGRETLALLRCGNPLDPTRTIRVPQWRTNLLLAESILMHRSNTLLRCFP